MNNRFLFIINPVSGRKSKGKIPQIIDSLFSDGFDYKIVFTSFSGEAPQIAERYINEGYNRVIAIGGDGTVNEVASALTGKDAVLGIVPLGSGNGLARHLKIPMDSKKALELIKNGSSSKMDYGIINGQKFFCTTGVGFDAHIGYIFSKLDGRGFSNYIKATISEFRKYKAEKYEIEVNGKSFTREAYVITAANATQYGNNAHIAPKADIQDGKLEVVIMRPFSLIASLGIGARLFLKNMDKSRYVETYTTDNVTITRKEPDVIHYDGEPGEMGEKLEIKIVKQGLNVITGM